MFVKLNKKFILFCGSILYSNIPYGTGLDTSGIIDRVDACDLLI